MRRLRPLPSPQMSLPELTNNSRKGTDHTDGSSSIRSPMVPGFSKGSLNGLPVHQLHEDGEDNNEMMDDITSAYATETLVDDDRSAWRHASAARDRGRILTEHRAHHITDPPTPHSAVNVPHKGVAICAAKPATPILVLSVMTRPRNWQT